MVNNDEFIWEKEAREKAREEGREEGETNAFLKMIKFRLSNNKSLTIEDIMRDSGISACDFEKYRTLIETY